MNDKKCNELVSKQLDIIKCCDELKQSEFWKDSSELKPWPLTTLWPMCQRFRYSHMLLYLFDKDSVVFAAAPVAAVFCPEASSLKMYSWFTENIAVFCFEFYQSHQLLSPCKINPYNWQFRWSELYNTRKLWFCEGWVKF